MFVLFRPWLYVVVLFIGWMCVCVCVCVCVFARACFAVVGRCAWCHLFVI